jgi:hypothetical protein
VANGRVEKRGRSRGRSRGSARRWHRTQKEEDGTEPKKKKKKKIKKKVSKGDKEEAKEIVRAAGDFVKNAPSNLNLEESKELLKRALSSMKLRAWSKAMEYAQQAQTKAEEVRDIYMGVAEEYSGLEKKFIALHDGGISIPSLDQRYFEVQNYIRSGELDEAKERILDLKTDLILMVPVYEDYLLLCNNIEEKRAQGVSVPVIDMRSQRIFEMIDSQKLDDAKTEMGALEDDMEVIIPIYEGYTELDNRIKDILGRAIAIEGVDIKVTEIIERMNENDWKGAKGTIGEANTMIDTVLKADEECANEAHDLLTEVYETLKAAPGHLNLEEPTQRYQRAKALFEAKSYRASREVSNSATEMIGDIRLGYNQVLDAISVAKDRLEEAQAEEGYADIDFTYYENVLISAKQTLMSNDFETAIHYTQDCLEQLEEAKKPIFNQLVNDVNERFKILGKEVMQYEPHGIDIGEAKDHMVDLQGDLEKAKDYGGYSRIWWDMDKLEDVLEEARKEYALLKDVPKFITYKLKDAKVQLIDMKDMGTNELGPLFTKLDECLDDYAMAGTESELETCKGKVTTLIRDVYKIRDSSVAMKNKRKAIDKILNTALNGIRKLKDESYDVSRLEQELDNKHNLVENAKTMKGLDFLHDEVGKWVTGINDIFEEEPELFNQKETTRNLIVEINKLYKKLDSEDIPLTEVKSKVELLNKMVPEATNLTEYKEVTSKAQPLLADLETLFETTMADKEKRDKATEDMEALKLEVDNYEGKADLTLVTHSLTLGEVALVSRQYAKALEFIEQCQREIEEIKGPNGSTVEIEISTENLQPNMWDQTNLRIKNTGKTILKDLEVQIEGPVDIRRIKPLAKLDLNEEIDLDVGVMFRGAGKIPLDMRISAIRLLDDSKIEIQKDIWVTITPGTGAAPGEAPKAAAPDKSLSEEDEIIKKLEKLASLKEKGIISEYEFEKKKKELLDQY